MDVRPRLFSRSHALRGNAVFAALRLFCGDRLGRGTSKTAFPRRAWEREHTQRVSVVATCFALLVLATALSSVTVFGAGAAAEKRTWDFESDAPGKIARGFTNEVGQWVVAKDGDNHVLAQTAKNDDDTFNVALAADTSYKDLDLSVRLKAVAGELDQGGGLVWRAKDAKNYYIARYNPLEDNFRVYKVEAGKRTQFKSAKIPGDQRWHTLRVTMTGNKITCYFDGTKHLEAEDSTFPGAGKIGLWSKSDARSYFDNLTVQGE